MEEEDADYQMKMLTVYSRKAGCGIPGMPVIMRHVLEPGNYTVGYDLFPGSYQLECTVGNVRMDLRKRPGRDRLGL